MVQSPRKLYLISFAYLVIVGVAMMIQNYIRYSVHSSYRPWNTATLLLGGLVLFIFVVPLFHTWLSKVWKNWPSLFSVTSVISILLLPGWFFVCASGLMYWVGRTDSFFAENFTRFYFGRVILFHLGLLIGVAAYVSRTRVEETSKTIMASQGRKKITVPTELITWIEADDHYLKIHCSEGMLVKRSTLEKMTAELNPDFARIHRKYAVNKKRVVGKEKLNRDEFLILSTGERLKVGRSYQPLDFI